MKGTPAFQMYPKDLLADRNVETMTNEQLGAYIRLMCWEWIDSGLPSDPDEIKTLARGGDNWSEIRTKVLACFVNKNGNVFHPRLKKERAKQAESRKRRAAAGSRGGKATKAKRLQAITESSNAGSNADSNAADLLPAKSSSSSTTSSTTSTAVNKEKETKRNTHTL